MAKCCITSLQVSEGRLALVIVAPGDLQVIHAQLDVTLTVENTTVILGRDIQELAIDYRDLNIFCGSNENGSG